MTSVTARSSTSGATAQTAGGSKRLPPWRNPWRHPWFLEGFTWLYLLWSLAPIAIAVLFSFNQGKSQATYQGLSWRWYFGDPVNSVLHNPALQSCGVHHAEAVRLHHADRGAHRSRVRAGHQPVAEQDLGQLQLRDDPVVRGARADLRRGHVLRVHQAVHRHPARPAGRDPGPGDLERELAGHHRPGPARRHRQALRGGGGRPGRHPVADDSPGDDAAAVRRPSSPARSSSSPASSTTS